METLEIEVRLSQKSDRKGLAEVGDMLYDSSAAAPPREGTNGALDESMLTSLAISSSLQPDRWPATLIDWIWRNLLLTLSINAGERGALPADATDEILMTAYRSGDSSAFRALFDRYAPKLLSAAQRRGLSIADAKDVIQQTFIHVHQSRRDFREGAEVRPWLYTIAFNVMRDFGRRLTSQKNLKQRVTLERPDPMTGTTAEERRSEDEIKGAIDLLPDAQREVLVLHYYEDMSFGEIAEMLGAGEGAIRVRAHRAYQKLRQLLTPARAAGGVL